MIAFVLSGFFGALGIWMVLNRRSIFGVVLATQLLGTGAALAFVSSGLLTGKLAESSVYTLLVALIGIAQMVAGYALSVRLFYLKRRTSLDELRSLKQ